VRIGHSGRAAAVGRLGDHVTVLRRLPELQVEDLDGPVMIPKSFSAIAVFLFIEKTFSVPRARRA
jgi:hypothetical protein